MVTELVSVTSWVPGEKREPPSSPPLRAPRGDCIMQIRAWGPQGTRKPGTAMQKHGQDPGENSSSADSEGLRAKLRLAVDKPISSQSCRLFWSWQGKEDGEKRRQRVTDSP